MLQYNIPNFRNSLEFLTLFAKKHGYTQKGGVPNTEQAATIFLADWTGWLLMYFFSQERGELYFGNEDKDEFLDIFMKTSNPTLIHEESCSDKPERGDFSLILDICFSLVLRSATTAKTRTTTIPLPM